MASRDENESEALRAEVARLRADVTSLEEQLNSGRDRRSPRMVRYRSNAALFGMPLISIAMGPDHENGQLRGHAKGVFAFGDIATGIIAAGGVSFGVVAIGGVAAGLVAVGGVAIGVIAGVGGVASGYFAVGGVAIGVETIGGAQVKV